MICCEVCKVLSYLFPKWYEWDDDHSTEEWFDWTIMHRYRKESVDWKCVLWARTLNQITDFTTDIQLLSGQTTQLLWSEPNICGTILFIWINFLEEAVSLRWPGTSILRKWEVFSCIWFNVEWVKYNLPMLSNIQWNTSVSRLDPKVSQSWSFTKAWIINQFLTRCHAEERQKILTF